MRTLRNLKLTSSLLLICSLGGCATAGMTTAESVSRLEQQQRANPSSAAVNRSLGIAYYKAEQFMPARASLEAAQRLDPKDGTTLLYLGLADESLNDLPAAKEAYSSYLKFGRTSRVRGQLQARLAALTQKQLVADAKSAVATEGSLGGQAGNPRTIAVLPLRFSGADSTLKPLERGFADLLTTDLSRSSQLTLVERSRMQALIDEIKLQQSGNTDASSNVRAGRLLRAGRMVQGSINQVDAQSIRVDAAVVDVPTSQIAGVTNGVDQLDQIFNLEKKIALDLFTQLGVTLTVAERNLIEQRPTRSLTAFIAYSRGLTAEDEGRYDDASRFFNEAVRIDPGFSAAQSKSAEVRQVTVGATISPRSVETSLKGTTEGAVATAAARGDPAPTGGISTGLGSAAQSAAGELNPSATSSATAASVSSSGSSTPAQKDPVSSGTGSDLPASTAKVTIVIRRP